MRRYPSAPVVCVGAVILDGERVVLIRRGQPPLKGVWSLPGGVIEVGETLDVAVAREAFEETGLRVEVGPLVEVVDRIERTDDGRVEYHYVIADYRCRVTSGDLACGSDADDARWVDVAELEAYAVTEATAAVVRKAMCGA